MLRTKSLQLNIVAIIAAVVMVNTPIPKSIKKIITNGVRNSNARKIKMLLKRKVNGGVNL
jgi:hypothetical protein